jgi:SpoVK/Ycf46/Vps4 family AAA+-type ATPase
MLGYNKQNMSKKRELESPDDEFNINDYNITDLDSLINMIEDYMIKPCTKKTKRMLPKKFNKLVNILDELCELNNLIGLKVLKQQLIDQILFFVKEVEESIMMHTVIYGPPGTGKTSVARIMARIYAGLGILKKNKFREVKREDLIGQYLGETTIKTMETLEECKNGVMFIDEAYSLGDDSKGDSYSKEAIDAINQYLTEHSHELICIIAGYKNELEYCFFAKNPGLKRRFPWTFSINEFGVEELMSVLKIKIEASEWDYEDSYDQIRSLISQNKQYLIGNGGDIENILSKAKIINIRKNFLKNDKTLTQDDIIESINQFLLTRKETKHDPPFGMYT